MSNAPVLETVTTVTGSGLGEESNAIESGSEDEYDANANILTDTNGDKVRHSRPQSKTKPLEDQRITQTELKIRSSELLNALHSVVKYYPGQTLMGDVATFQEPFRLLVHYREELEAYKQQHPPEHNDEYRQTCNEHIDILLGFLKRHFGKSLEEEERRQHQDPPVCTFEWAWLLLKPGDTIYAETDERIPGLPSP
ncbi:hypothetical protein EPUS_00529 [Endocarpon pusillum Z07020]|uniref:Uncharacterized protein n=1 Tax=Endocarpon pusillum (strain Z07020 / HMAS-L-300199) TaxID=1263415 RepID=U1HMJ6_ENDPU|nr:uncharacterized protein EPUS_00529 [Endocarpon pusillum Z07020]ERF71540.1 hypothetical protein EPUS_00529 [Endocarpon pusillum Z07020]